MLSSLSMQQLSYDCPIHLCPLFISIRVHRHLTLQVELFLKDVFIWKTTCLGAGVGGGERPPIWLPVEHTAPEPKSGVWRSIDWATGALLQVKIFKNVVIEINFTCFREINDLNNQWGRFILTFISFTKHIFFVFT